jgi:serine/threonine-protein kinase
MALTVGTQLGSLEITALLGKGGMGEVYRARDLKLKREVAIKILPEEFSADTDRVSRFQREAEVLASLNHPHIAAIHNFEETNGTRYLVLELVEGETLADRLMRGPMPFDEAVQVARQIVDALEAAHERGIVHRDLKPGNIKIGPDGKVKVLDFGLAKVVASAQVAEGFSNSPTLMSGSMGGVILGTASYMSPEQARGKPVDKRADIWAFGAMLYEMVTAKRLFAGEDLTDTLATVVKIDPDLSAAPRQLRRLLKKCLEKDPRKRLRDIGDVWELLDEPNSDAERVTAKARPTAWIVAAALAFIAATLGLGLWRALQFVEQPLVRLEVELGANVSLPVPAPASNAAIISPDGTRLAYVSGTPLKLFIRKLDQPKATELAGTENARAAFFSPDSVWLGFVSAGGDKLNKISAEGGAVVPLVNSQFLARAAWSEDGNIYIGQATTDGQNPPMLRIPAAGGAATKVMEPTGDPLVYNSEQILPGGKAVMLSAYPTNDPEASSIQILTLSDHKTKTITPGASRARYVPSGHLIYAVKGTLFAVPFDLDRLETRGTPTPVLDDLAYSRATLATDFDVSAAPAGHGTLVYRRGGPMGGGGGQTSTIQWVDTTGKREPLIAKPSFYRTPRISPDGKRLALIADLRPLRTATTTVAGGDVWVYDLARDNLTQLTRGESYGFALWTLDGKYLILATPGSGLMWLRADGSTQPRVLVASKTPMAPESITTDGKLVYHDNTDPNALQIWTVSLTEESGQLKAGKPELFLGGKGASYLQAAVSPDGKWLAYSVSERSAAGAPGMNRSRNVIPELYVQPFPASPDGMRVHVSNNGGGNPVWSRTGELLYASPADGNIMAVKYSARNGEFVASKPRVWLANATRGRRSASFDLHPDGTRLAILVPEDDPAQAETPKPDHTLVFLLNFFDELRRRAPIH